VALDMNNDTHTAGEAMGKDREAAPAGLTPGGLKQSWERIGQMLRAELGEDLYSSWFARMEAERLRGRPAGGLGADAVPAQLDRGPLRRPAAAHL
jgi:hypothetical protein